MTAFATSVDRLINQVGSWEQARWWTHLGTRPGANTRADLLYVLVQHLADAGADAESRPRRPVPRLSDLVLPDQLRVIADDLMAADPGEDRLKLAAEDVDALRHTLA